MNNFAHCSTVSEPRDVANRLFAGHNLLVISEHFRKNPYPSEAEMTEIANQFKVGVDKVKNWFYSKQRRAVKKGEHFDIQNRRVIKGREKFTSEQYLILRKAYESSSGKIPDSKEMEKLAMELKEKDFQKFKKWFYNRKAREQKKQSLRKSSHPYVTLYRVCMAHTEHKATQNENVYNSLVQ